MVHSSRFPGLEYRNLSAHSTSPPLHDLSVALSNQLDKQHRCDICSKQFSRASILRDHIRRHEKEKPFQCATCKKAFANKSDLKRHEDVHAGRKFACELCGRQFTRRLAITKHICTPYTLPSVNILVAQSIENDPLRKYIPSSTRSTGLRLASMPSPDEPSIASQPSQNSSRRTIPLPAALPPQHASAKYHSISDSEDSDNDNGNEDTHSEVSEADSGMSSNTSDHTEPLPDWEDYAFKCGICPAQYEHKIPLARHQIHHLEEMDLRPYRCNTCKISFAFYEELSKHEIYDQREQLEGPCLSLPCIWNCGKVFTSADACREHVSASIDLRCKVGMALEVHLRITVLQKFKELIAPEGESVQRAIQRLIDQSLNGYQLRSLDLGWFHRIIANLDEE